MAKREPLPFLMGTFSWSKRGFFYAAAPPVDLLSQEALDPANPWLFVAAVLERAKRGDHSRMVLLQRWFRTTDEGHLDRICMLLTGDAGREADVRTLGSFMQQGPDDPRTYACEAAAQAGYLWQVPDMLEAWSRVANEADHQTIGYAIAALLEEPGGPIAAEAGTYNLDPSIVAGTSDPKLREVLQQVVDTQPLSPEFEVLVRARLSELQDQFRTDQVVVWRGEKFNVRRLAETLYARVTGPVTPAMSFIRDRHRFEAATGIDCSAFYRDNQFQPLAAAEIFETFLEGPKADRYEEGIRYFFGHRIPD
jgi:hypothetical protein